MIYQIHLQMKCNGCGRMQPVSLADILRENTQHCECGQIEYIYVNFFIDQVLNELKTYGHLQTIKEKLEID